MEDYCIEKYLEEYDTTVTPLDLEYGKEDEFGVVYSLDGKRLLQNRNFKLKDYEVKPGTEVICNDAFSFKSLRDTGACPPPTYCLREIKLPNSIRMIGDQAFLKTHMSKINLPERLLRIGSKAFFFTNISYVTLPERLRQIGDFAFGLTIDLKAIRIPANVTYIGKAPFANCFGLESIEVAEGNVHFTVYDGILYDCYKTRLIQCPCTKTKNFDIPDTAIICDTGAFCRDTNMEEIPEVTKMRWRLQRMKEIWLQLVDGPCGVRTFIFSEIGRVISIKLSNSIYCNIKCSYDKDGKFSYLIDSKNDFITLMNALCVDKIDIARALGMIDEVQPRKNKYGCYLNREVAKTIKENWLEDFVDEDTGEVVTIERTQIVVFEGQYLAQWMMEDLFSSESIKKPFTLLLYKDSNVCNVDWSTYYYIKDSENHPQEEALHLLNNEISHLRFLYYQKHKDYLLHAFIQTALLPSFEEEMEPVPKISDNYPSTCLPWTTILTKFFEDEMIRMTPQNFSYKKVFQDFKRIGHVDKMRNKDFANSFSFLFENIHDCFADGPFL